MDALSDVIASMRLGQPYSSRVIHHAPFGWRLPAVGSAGFHVVLSGRCWLLPPVGDPVELEPGDIVLLPEGSAHGLADDPARQLRPAPTTADPADEPEPSTIGTGSRTELLCGAYRLDRSRSHPMLADLPQVLHLPARATRHTSLGAIVGLLEAELVVDRPGSDAMVRALLDSLLIHVLRSWFDRPGTGWSAALNDPALGAALAAIHDSPWHTWTVAELADRSALSRAGFARRFTALIGRPPIAYLTWWRVTLAARQLRDTDATMAVIARRAGYASEFAFAHAFKNEFGCPPGRFRRRLQVAGAADR